MPVSQMVRRELRQKWCRPGAVRTRRRSGYGRASSQTVA